MRAKTFWKSILGGNNLLKCSRTPRSQPQNPFPSTKNNLPGKNSLSIFIMMIKKRRRKTFKYFTIYLSNSSPNIFSPNILQFSKYSTIHQIFSPFARAVEADFQLISKAFKNQLIIPEFPNFCGILRDIYEECRVGLAGKKFFSNLIFFSLEN